MTQQFLGIDPRELKTYTAIPHFIECFTLLHFKDNAFFSFLQIEGLCQPCIKQIFKKHFSNSVCSLYVSMSHFGNSHNLSKQLNK